ncbi:MAG: DNA methylase, partial [Ignavibacteria bacterium]|nr:DNA methylase [Ignavibacteria bacterium]
KYEKVMDFEGNIIRADRLLEFVREIVTDYAVRQLLHNGIAGELSALTRFYLLYRWTFGESRVPFDDARKLAQSTGVDLEKEWNKGFIQKEKEFVRVLGPHEREFKKPEDIQDLIDVLHFVLLLWEKSRTEDLKRVLAETGYGTKDYFYRVAQAISETFYRNNESTEKKLLDGFLTGKDRYINEILKEQQGKIF